MSRKVQSPIPRVRSANPQLLKELLNNLQLQSFNRNLYELKSAHAHIRRNPAKEELGNGGGAGDLSEEHRQSATRVADVVELRPQQGSVAARSVGPDATKTALSADRQRLQHLLAVSPAIIYSTKASGDFACTFVSENIRTIMGFAPEDMLADPKCWPDRLHPEDGPRVFEELPPLIERGGGMLVYRFRHADGSYLWIQDTFKVVNDEHGQPMELVGAWADISERRRAEQQALEANAELHKTKRSLSRLIESSPNAIIATDKGGNVTLFNEGAEALLGYRAEEVVGRSVAPLYGGEAGMNEVLREMERRGGTVSGIDSLLWAKDSSSIPVLISASLLFDDDGRQIGTVGFATDLRERRRTLEELSGVRLRLEHLLAVSPAIIYSTKASGDFACTFVSENIRTIMGFAPEDMLTDPKCWPDRLHPEDGPRVFEELTPLIERGGGTLVYRFRRADGSYLWIQDTFKVVNDEHGQPMELVGAWADISERRRAEQQALEANAELQKTKGSLSRLIESSPDAIIATDKNGNVTLFSEGAETLLGYRAEEAIGRSVALLYGGEAGVNEVLREMHKRGGTVSGFEGVLWAKDQSAIPVLISASLLFDDGGEEIGTVGFATDLRERKRGEEAVQKAYDELEKRVEERTLELREARGRLQYLLTVTPGIMYTNKASGDFACTFVSQNVETIMGFSGWEMTEDPEFWLKRLHPNDVKTLFDRMAPLIDAGGGAIEYRFRHRDGHYVWIQDTFKVVPDEAGKPYEIVGSWADITDRKQVEQALGERMALMNDLQNLVAASPAVIYTTKATDDFSCTFVSENLVTTMGYAPWEMRDDPKFWSKRVHPDDASAIFSSMDKLVGKGGGAIEYRFRHRRGHYIWVQDTFSVKCDKDGQPKELVGSWADITDRKQIEAEMTRLAAEVELRNRFIRETFGRYLTDQVVDFPVGIASGTEDWRREAQGHHADGRFARLHSAVRAPRPEGGRRPSQPIPFQHGRHRQEIRRDDRAIYRRCDLRSFRRPDVEGGRRAARGGLRRRDATSHGFDQRSKRARWASRTGNGHRAAHRTSRRGQYRRARADAVRGDRKPRQSHPAHTGLHLGGADSHFRDDAA